MNIHINKFRKKLTACITTQNKHLFMNNKMSKNASLPRHWYPDSRVTFKVHRVLIWEVGLVTWLPKSDWSLTGLSRSPDSNKNPVPIGFLFMGPDEKPGLRNIRTVWDGSCCKSSCCCRISLGIEKCYLSCRSFFRGGVSWALKLEAIIIVKLITYAGVLCKTSH